MIQIYKLIKSLKNLKKKTIDDKKKFIFDTLKKFLFVIPIIFLIRTIGIGLGTVPKRAMETSMLVEEKFIVNKFFPLFINPKRGYVVFFNDPNYKYSDNKILNLLQRYIKGPQSYAQRIIAIPGDEIKGMIENDKPVIYLKTKNDNEFKKLNEPYINQYPLVAYVNTQAKDKNKEELQYITYDPNYSFKEQPFYKFSKESLDHAKTLSKECGFSEFLYPQVPVYLKGKNTDIFHHKLNTDQYWLMGDNRQNATDSRIWGPINGKYLRGIIKLRIWSYESSGTYFVINLIKHPINVWKRIRWDRMLRTI